MRPLPSMWDLHQIFSLVMPDGLEMCSDRLTHIFGSEAIHAATAKLLEHEERGWNLKLHAEAAMAHFFFSGRRRFAGEDRYIGCSKASCSSCEVYLQFHPGQFEQRPHHGNTWTQWRFPGWSDTPEPEMVTLMQRMIETIQNDIKRSVISGSQGHKFTLDSSTNMSTLFEDRVGANNDGRPEWRFHR